MNDSQPIIDLIYAFRKSKAMFTAVSLGVFERLENGPAEASAFPGGEPMERLLDTCVALGLLYRQDGLYGNTPLSARYLCRSSADSMSGYIQYSDTVLFRMWQHLEEAVQEGTNRWQAAFGFPAAELFDHFYVDEQKKREFLLGMHGFGRISSPHVIRAFDLARFRRFVDLGGGTGHLALAALDVWPQMHATVFDLPAAVQFAAEFTAGRVELIAGDFFHHQLPLADLYAVGRILHDWSDAKIAQLLHKVYAALPSGGALLVAEILLDDDKQGPLDAHLQSLNMLVCTEGRERSLAEYRVLLESAGFINVEGRRTGTPLDAVLAVKP